ASLTGATRFSKAARLGVTRIPNPSSTKDRCSFVPAQDASMRVREYFQGPCGVANVARAGRASRSNYECPKRTRLLIAPGVIADRVSASGPSPRLRARRACAMVNAAQVLPAGPGRPQADV